MATERVEEGRAAGMMAGVAERRKKREASFGEVSPFVSVPGR